MAKHRIETRAHFRNANKRFQEMRRALKGSIHRNQFEKRFRRFETLVLKRTQRRLRSFGKARDACSRYFFSHSLQRYRREYFLAKQLRKCAALPDGSIRRCRHRVMRRFRVWVTPGNKARKNRRGARFLKIYRRWTALSELIVEHGVSTRVNQKTAELWAELRRHRSDALRRRHACTTSACRRRTAHSLRRLRRQFRLLKRLRGCAHRKTRSGRRECVSRLSLKLRRLNPTRKRVDESHLPIEERRRRQRERRQLVRLHRRAARCGEHDIPCTKKNHRLIRQLMRRIARRRRRWERVHAASHRARLSWASLKKLVRSMRSRLHRCNGRARCIRRVLRHLISRTKRSIAHFAGALRKCPGKSCRVLVKRYHRALNLFLNRLRRHLLRAQAREFTARQRRREARRKARRARHLARLARRLARRRAHKVLRVRVRVHHHRFPTWKKKSVGAVARRHRRRHHWRRRRAARRRRRHAGRRRRRAHHYRSMSLTARLSLYRSKCKSCRGNTSCLRRHRRRVRHFFSRVHRHLHGRRRNCKTRACRRRVRQAIRKLRRVRRAALRCRRTARYAKKGRCRRHRKAIRRHRRRYRKCATKECRRRHRRAIKAHRRRLASKGCSKKGSSSRHRYSSAYLFAGHHSHHHSRRRHHYGPDWLDNSGVTDVSDHQLRSFGFDPSLSTPALATVLYQRLVLRLSRCAPGVAGRPCRHGILRRFRKVLHSREHALIKLLKWRARGKLARTVADCVRTTTGNVALRDSCLNTAMQVYADRLQSLQERTLEIRLRDAVRMCETMSNEPTCLTKAQEAYQRDLATSRANSVARAQALIQQLKTTGGVAVTQDPFDALIHSTTADQIMTVPQAQALLAWFTANGAPAWKIAQAQAQLEALQKTSDAGLTSAGIVTQTPEAPSEDFL